MKAYRVIQHHTYNEDTLTEEEYEHHLVVLEEEAESDLQKFIHFDLLNTMEEMRDYEDRKAEELFQELDGIMKEIIDSFKRTTKTARLKENYFFMV